MFVAGLSSGSAGNCYYLQDGETGILVDAGLSLRETTRRLQLIGRSIDSLRAIVITHEHYDHIRGAEKIAQKLAIPVYLTSGTLEASNIDRKAAPTVVFENNSTFRIGDLNIHARRTIHDAADPACFVVEAGDGTRVGIASDLGHVDLPVRRHLEKCDGLFFESNHDVDMLRGGTYPWSLKRRILSRYGHLSNDEAMSAVTGWIDEHLKMLCLIHLSEKNNHETIVRSMADQVIATTGAHLDLHVAKQSEPTPMLEIRRKVAVPRPTALPAPRQMSLFG